MKRKAKTVKQIPIWWKPNRLKAAKRPRTLRDALDIIQELLLDRPYSHDLWNVLTALRGPDSQDGMLKRATTCVIRKTAFPEEPTAGLSMFNPDSPELARDRAAFLNSLFRIAPHFEEHFKDAFESLGLKLLSNNSI